jgi:hypothetical protein
MRFNYIMSLGLGKYQSTETSCMSPCLNPLTTSKTKISVTDVKYGLTANSSKKYSKLGLLWWESNWELNTQDVEGFLRFLKIIYTSAYGQGFGSYGFLKLTGGWKSALDRIEHPDKSDLLTPIRMHSQETSNTSIIDDVLSFLKHPHMTSLIKLNQSYQNLKTARKCGFQQKGWNPFWCRSKVRISSRTELQEQFIQKWSRDNDLFRLGLNFKAASLSIQFYPFG